MKLITRDTDYAIRAIVYMARHRGQIISTKGLVANLKVPRPFLRKIMQVLDQKGLLRSYKGKGGGFVLKTLPQQILLFDLIKIFQGRFSLSECFLKKHICPHIKSCRLRKKIKAMETYLIKELKKINIAYLIN